MIEKNFIYNMKIYQLLSAVTFRDSPAHPVSFVSKHGYDWLNAYKQLEVWKYFSAQLESIVFLLYYIYHLCFTCTDFYDLSAWGGFWFVVYIRRFIYKFLNVCPFD